jgi:hypothetical protein
VDCTLHPGPGPGALSALVRRTQIADSIFVKSRDSAWQQSCPRVILCKETRQIYIHIVYKRWMPDCELPVMPVEIVVFLSLENGTCAALSTCATPPRPQPIVALPCETSPSLAVARITATLPLCWTLQPSSLRCAQSAHRCRFRPCSDLTPASRSLLTHELLQIPLP